jgi:hypothetical protein
MKKDWEETTVEAADEKLSRRKSNWQRHVTGTKEQQDAKNSAKL